MNEIGSINAEELGNTWGISCDESQFKDTEWTNALTWGVERGAIDGPNIKKQCQFRPNEGVQRAEFAKIFSEGMNIAPYTGTSITPYYDDVGPTKTTSNEWYYGYVYGLSRSGIVNAPTTKASYFTPTKKLNLAEISKMLVKNREKDFEGEVDCYDEYLREEDKGKWYSGYIGLLVKSGVLEEWSYPRADEEITRKGMIELMYSTVEQTQTIRENAKGCKKQQYQIHPDILKKWNTLGGENGQMGEAIGETQEVIEVKDSKETLIGYRQEFKNGIIFVVEGLSTAVNSGTIETDLLRSRKICKNTENTPNNVFVVMNDKQYDWERLNPVVMVHGLNSSSCMWESSLAVANPEPLSSALSESYWDQYRFDKYRNDNVYDTTYLQNTSFKNSLINGGIPQDLIFLYNYENRNTQSIRPTGENMINDMEYIHRISLLGSANTGSVGVYEENNQIKTTKEGGLNVIAHSMGGLVTRSYMREQFERGKKDYIKQLYEIGTPNLGSYALNLPDRIENDIKVAVEPMIKDFVSQLPFISDEMIKRWEESGKNAIAENSKAFILKMISSNLSVDPHSGAGLDLTPNSNFLLTLNNILHPLNYRTFIGEIDWYLELKADTYDENKNLTNKVLWENEDYIQGDVVVTKESGTFSPLRPFNKEDECFGDRIEMKIYAKIKEYILRELWDEWDITINIFSEKPFIESNHMELFEEELKSSLFPSSKEFGGGGATCYHNKLPYRKDIRDSIINFLLY